MKITQPSKTLLCKGVFFAILIFFSCKKMDIRDEKMNNRQPVSDFFKITPALPNEILRVANKLKELDRHSLIISELIQKDGFAIWDKAEIAYIPSPDNASKHKGRNALLSTDTIVYIPLVLQGTDYVNSFIYAKLTDSVQLRLYRGREYPHYDFGNITDNTDKAERLALQIMMLNKRVFGYTDFRLEDSRLFKHNGNSYPTADNISRIIKVGAATSQNRYLVGGGNGEWGTSTIFVCVTNTIFHCTNTGSCARGICDQCYLCKETNTECETVVQYYFIPSDDDGLNNNMGGDGGGGGGGTGVITTNGPVPCNPNPLLDNGLIPCEEGNFTGWTIKDEHGFLYSRMAQLDSLLAQNKFALLPCDSLNLMPILSYGNMYKKVAQYPVPQIVLDRLDSLTTYGPSPLFAGDYFNVQSLNDAGGKFVNCDFFPIQISQMPLKANGIPYTPKELVEYFRLHKNDFIDPSVGIYFEPYNYNGFNDSARFNAPYEQSIGAVLHIHMPKDGSIVHTGYTNKVEPSTNYQEHSFIYTTLSTGLDFEHPVSGNREFGIYSDQNNPGSYIFYTMGVDRITNLLYQFIDNRINDFTGHSGFDKADELWTSIQEKMINFINTRGGQAALYARKNTIARPKWKDAGDFLRGLISLQEYKQRLGC